MMESDASGTCGFTNRETHATRGDLIRLFFTALTRQDSSDGTFVARCNIEKIVCIAPTGNEPQPGRVNQSVQNQSKSVPVARASCNSRYPLFVRPRRCPEEKAKLQSIVGTTGHGRYVGASQ